MHPIHFALIPMVMLTGCATNLSAVSEFANQTNQIAVAFQPVLEKAVEHCQQKFLQRRIYTTDAPLEKFDAADVIKNATDTCQPIADQNAIARRISDALSAYANQLSTLATDTVANSLDDDFDSLASKMNQFDEIPQDKVASISVLLKFISRGTVAKSQHKAIEEALSHDQAVGALADALVLYSDRVYAKLMTERLSDQQLFAEVLRSETATPTSSRIRLIELHEQTLKLNEQRKTTENLHIAVNQMQISMQDLKQNLDKLSAIERLKEARKLAKEVKELYQQLNKAF